MSITSNIANVASALTNGTEVHNLNAEFLNGQPGSYYTSYAETANTNNIIYTNNAITSNVEVLQGVNATQNASISAAFLQANSAYDNSNTKFSSSGGSISGPVTIDSSLLVTGDFTVSGNTTTLNVETLTIEDKNIVLANTASPTDILADGAGLTIKGDSDKTFNWVDSTDSWTSSENLNLLSGKTFKIAGTDVLSGNTLGSGITSSSLTSVGTLGSLNVTGNVGIGTSPPSRKLHVYGGVDGDIIGQFQNGSGSTSHICFSNTGSNADQVRIGSSGGDLLLSTNYTERLRIDASGNVGIGTSSPTRKLQVYDTTSGYQFRLGYSNSYYYDIGRSSIDGYFDFYGNQTGAIGYRFGGADGTRLTLDSSGNLGLGVTPSAYSSETKAFDIGAYGVSIANTAGYQATYANNAYYNAGWKYKATGYQAALYTQSSGAHHWQTAPSGTAGNAISFTQAMTLTAAGKLLVGATSLAAGLGLYAQIEASGPQGGIIINSSSTGASDYSRIMFAKSNASGNEGLIRYSTYDYHMAFWTDAVERLRIDSSGNVGIGVTPSVGWVSGWSATLQIKKAAFSGFGYDAHISSNGYWDGATWHYMDAGVVASNYYQNAGAHVWRTTNTTTGSAGGTIAWSTPMTLTAAGNLLVGTTSATSQFVKFQAASNVCLGIANATVTAGSITLNAINDTNTVNIPLDIRCSQFYITSGVSAGSGTSTLKFQASGAVTYDTSSERYKDNIRDSLYGLSDVLALRSAMFEYKNDGRTDVGLIAEEVLPVIPELVSLNKDGLPESVAYDRFVSVLVKAIQELSAEIESLKAKVN